MREGRAKQRDQEKFCFSENEITSGRLRLISTTFVYTALMELSGSLLPACPSNASSGVEHVGRRRSPNNATADGEAPEEGSMQI